MDQFYAALWTYFAPPLTDEHLGPVEGVRAVLTGHTPSQEPRCDRPGFGRLTIARVDGKEIETWSFDR